MSSFPQPGEYFNKRYFLESVLGAGGIGTVFKAVQLDCNRKLAIKILHPEVMGDEEFKKRFLREAKVLGKLHHENIVSVYHIAVSGRGLPYIAMELLRGESLRAVINKTDKFLPLRALSIITQCASALAFVHLNEVVHRDLKPENILLVNEPRPDTVKIIDFGLARAKDTKEQKLTKTGVLIGSVLYMSPEQSMGVAVTPQSDIYALGVILFELLTGHRPFDADNPIGLMYMQSHSDVPLLKADEMVDFDPRINVILQRALARDLEKRYQSMSEFESALHELISTWGKADAMKLGMAVSTSFKPKKKVRGLIVVSTLLGLYAVYLCWSACSYFFNKGSRDANTSIQADVGSSDEQVEQGHSPKTFELKILELERQGHYAKAQELLEEVLRRRKSSDFLNLHSIYCAPHLQKARAIARSFATEPDCELLSEATELYSKLSLMSGDFLVPMRIGDQISQKDLRAGDSQATRLVLLQLLAASYSNLPKCLDILSNMRLDGGSDELLTYLEVCATLNRYSMVDDLFRRLSKPEQITDMTTRDVLYIAFACRNNGEPLISKAALDFAKKARSARKYEDVCGDLGIDLENLEQSPEAESDLLAHRAKLRKLFVRWKSLATAANSRELACSAIPPAIIVQALLNAEMYDEINEVLDVSGIKKLVSYRCTLNEALMCIRVASILNSKNEIPAVQRLLQSISSDYNLDKYRNTSSAGNLPKS